MATQAVRAILSVATGKMSLPVSASHGIRSRRERPPCEGRTASFGTRSGSLLITGSRRPLHSVTRPPFHRQVTSTTTSLLAWQEQLHTQTPVKRTHIRLMSRELLSSVPPSVLYMAVDGPPSRSRSE